MKQARKKTLVLECSHPMWLDVMKRLHDENGWDPIYWTAHSGYLDFSKIKLLFPEAVLHENYDAVKGKPASEFKKIVPPPVDSELIKWFSYHEVVVLKMMDRMDPIGRFTYSERVRLFYTYIKYWNFVLEELKPDLYISPVTPHLCYDYILFELCKYKNIPCLLFLETTVPYNILLGDDFKISPPQLVNRYKKLLETEDEPGLSASAEAYLNKIKGTYTDGIPSYMIDQMEFDKKRSKEGLFQKLLHQVREIGSNIKHGFVAKNLNPVHVYYKAKEGTIEDQNFSESERVLYYRAMQKRTKKLNEQYNQIVSNVEFDKPYLFVALMYQPERTSCPEGDIFVDQYLMIEWLSSCVPEGWLIYVKEHPSQFLFHVDQTRNEWFYSDLKKLPNIRFVSTGTDTFKLIDHARAVATLTGTVGLEAIVRSKPVLTFGYAWYRQCEGSLPVHRLRDLKDHLAKIERGFVPNEKKVRKFIQALEEVSVKAFVEPYYEKGMDYQLNVTNLTHAMQSFVENNSLRSKTADLAN